MAEAQPVTPGLIAFDLDGTLIDSAAGIHASLVAACAALDVPPPSRERLQRHIGPPLRDYLPGLLGFTPEQRDRLLEPLLQAFRQHHDREGWDLFQLYAGALELLQTLHTQGWQLHVVTLKPAPLAAQVLERSGIGALVRSLQAPQPGGRIHKAACLEQLRQLRPGRLFSEQLPASRALQRISSLSGIPVAAEPLRADGLAPGSGGGSADLMTTLTGNTCLIVTSLGGHCNRQGQHQLIAGWQAIR